MRTRTQTSVPSTPYGDDIEKFSEANRFTDPVPSIHEQAFPEEAPDPWELRLKALQREVERLPELERVVLRGRLGHDGRGEQTLPELADRLGISVSTVWRLEQRALARVACALNPSEWDSPDEAIAEGLRAA